MNRCYHEILDAMGEPKWWDEHAVPRYVDFTPGEAANIYARVVVLLEVRCQACGTPFKVCMSWGPFEAFPPSIDHLRYGDPPNMQCCPAGPTMSSDTVRVIEFWRREHFEWRRVPENERYLKEFDR